MRNIVSQVILNNKKTKGITQSAMKMAAVIGMLFSHIQLCYAWQGWGMIHSNQIMEMLGQAAFPIFAYGIIQGWEKTKDKEKYLENMFLLAAVSQIPYTMALYTVNLQKSEVISKTFYFHFNYKSFLALFIIFLYVYKKKFFKGKSCVIFGMAECLSCFDFCIQDIWFNYTGRLNVAYLFLVGMIVFSVLEQWEVLNMKEKLAEGSILGLMILFIASRAEYGMAGFVLLLFLYLCKNHEKVRNIGIVLWGFVVYAILYRNVFNAVSSIVSVVMISKYNGERGKVPKQVYYVFYPLHLFVFGCINLYMKSAG